MAGEIASLETALRFYHSKNNPGNTKSPGAVGIRLSKGVMVFWIREKLFPSGKRAEVLKIPRICEKEREGQGFVAHKQ